MSELLSDLYGILANFDSSQAGYYAIKPNLVILLIFKRYFSLLGYFFDKM